MSNESVLPAFITLDRDTGTVKGVGPLGVAYTVVGGGAISVGTFANTTLLQAAFPASSNLGAFAQVGTGSPYTQYTSNGAAWVVSGGGASSFGGLSDATTADIPGTNLKTALAIGQKLGLSLPFDPTQATIAAGVPSTAGNSWVAQNSGTMPGGVGVDDVPAFVPKGSVLVFQANSRWGIEYALPVGPGLVAVDASGNPSLAVPGGANSYTPAPVLQTGCAAVWPPSGTIGSNGALSGMPFALTYANAWFRFPAGAVFASSPAGWYFTKMTSGAVGTVYANYMSDADGAVTGDLQVPATLTALTGTTGIAYTQDVGSTYKYLPTVLVPGHAMGANGSLDMRMFGEVVSNTNNRAVGIFGGGSNFNLIQVTTATSSFDQSAVIYNTGVETAQNGRLSTGGTQTGTVDTSVSFPIRLGIRMNTAATDWLVIDFARVIMYPRA